MTGLEHKTDPVEFEVQWQLIHALPDSDMELHMELLKLPQINTSEVFYAVWNAAAHITER